MDVRASTDRRERAPSGPAPTAPRAEETTPRAEPGPDLTPDALRDRIAGDLDAARRRSLDLLEPLDEADLVRQHSPLMSPLVWDLAHVGNYEDLWLLRALGRPGVGPELDDIYDAFRHPRRDRPALPMLDPTSARAYLREVRGRALDHLERAQLDGDDPLVGRGFVYGMVIQHEQQHDETMLATLNLMAAPGYRPDAPAPPGAATVAVPDEVFVAAGPFEMGTGTDPWAYDNERPAHEVDVAAFWIDAAPVTNGQYAAFVDDGGYADPQWWQGAGWAWRQEAGLEHPQFWRRDGARTAWLRTRFGFTEPVPPAEPVQHVCWYEADAYARWAGKRLPTEAEWEKAAAWDQSRAVTRRYPWGDSAPDADRANLGQCHFGPAPVGAYPQGASAYGCVQMIGDVWEWTASDFRPYPGFVSHPYREYSEVFYGPDYKVLRGGSWATDPSAIRNTFRNWDYPIRRQIFAGFRCARDQ
jgi:iron(II)-dependent oxidoreductase